MKKLDEAKICYRFFIDSDIGENITAIATEPLKGEQRKIFSNYPLLKFGKKKKD